MKNLLDPADAAAVDSMGGANELPKMIDILRQQMAFLMAGQGASDDEDLSHDVMLQIQTKAEETANRAFMDSITAETRRFKTAAATLGEEVAPAPTFLDEGVSGLRDLADKMAEAKGYTKQNHHTLRALTPDVHPAETRAGG